MTSQAELVNRKEIKPQSKTNLFSSCHVHREKEQATQQREGMKQTPLAKQKGQIREREQLVFLMISQDMAPSLKNLPVFVFTK